MKLDAGVALSDDLLLQAVAHQDQSSFAELHSRLVGLVYSTAYRVLNDPDDAREVTQDVFTHVWEKARQFETRKGKATTWVYAMTRNRAIDRLRSNRRRFRLRDEFLEERKVNEGFRTSSPAMAEYERKDEMVRVGEAMAILTPEQREAIELVYGKDLTVKEASEWLELPLGTVKARVRRGLAALRQELDTNGR
ncbi:MAG: sigma-70 family RNA polymerase sigma factor [Verrucomicrobia bacterium]|nr:sigma-70 family RNA polymerase sigma factor [Verrucomicrobiota bacterium]